MEIYKINNPRNDFANRVEEMSHSGLNRCWHCLTCTNGCPFSEDMDFYPNSIIRMVQLGMKKQALESSTIWLCVGCNTCSTECPNAIDVAAMMDALRQIAINEADIAEPGILSFHKAVVNSIYRHGRTHKLEIMMRYKFLEKDLFSDADIGLRMLAKRKLDLLPSKVKNTKDLQALFDIVTQGENSHE